VGWSKLTSPPPAYDVFFSSQGNQGTLGKASKQQLENTFGTSRDDDIAVFMLKNGVMQHAERIGEKTGNTNRTR
jgi:ribosome maturation protein Sdo1